MNCLGLKIRECRETHKIKWVHRLKNSQKVDFIGLQETWVAYSNMIDVAGSWGNLDYNMKFGNPVGRSVGIVSIWDPLMFVKSITFSSRYFSRHIRLMARLS